MLTEDTADMTMALILAVPRRLVEGAAVLQDASTLGRLVADLDAGPPHLGQAARHHRHGPHRPGRGAPRQGLRPADPLSQPPPGRREIEQELEATYWESLDQMLARMDIVSVNCPHTPATYHLLSARRLKLLKPIAYIVNTARGEVIDENALARMLETGEIAGAGLDVFEHEPAINPQAAASHECRAAAAYGLGHHRRPHRHGRKGHHQHQDLCRRPQSARPRARRHVLAGVDRRAAMPEIDTRAIKAAAGLYHSYFTGLILTLVTRRSAPDAAEWVFRLFRHQHHEKFLSSFDKLGLRGMPDAVACAAYHYLSNSIGGVEVEFMRESERKAWVNFVPPRWIYPGASICGVPSEVSRAFLRGWYAQNGVSLGNPRLGFVCTAQTTDGQHGLSGYFLEHDRELAAG